MMFRSEKGMGLVELLVSVAILGIIVGTASTYFADSNKASKVEYLKELQQKIARDVEFALSNPDAIKNTMKFGSNTGLKNCIEVGATCTATNTEPPGTYITLLDSQATAEPLAGLTIGFDIDGKRCTIGAPKCLFNPVVKFWATCDLDASNKPKASCSKAGFINFKYQVNVVHPVYSKQMNVYPEKDNVDKAELRNIVRVRVADLLVRTDGSCKPNEMLMGIDAQGEPICECLVQKTSYVSGTLKPLFDGAGKKVCGEQACPKDTLMTGYQEVTQIVKGTKVKSIVPRCRGESECSVASPPADCPCKIINLGTTPDCGPGFWMVSIEHGVCEAKTDKNGKGAPETVTCGSKTARCCSFEQQ